MEQNYDEAIFFNSLDYFSALIKDIEQAQSSIDFETYIFSRDQLGQSIAKALINAAKRNIKIRILVDGAGTPNWGGQITKELEKAGVQTRIFHPIPWRFWQWSRAKINVPFLLKIIYLLLKINSRNHRKTCVIDQKIIYIGSFNIQGKNWRDTGVRLRKADISPLTEAFEAAWNLTPIQERLKSLFKHVHNDPIIRLNNTRHRRRILYKNLLRRIASCGQRIWITNAYFIPDNFILKKLENAALKGLDVRILLPQKSDILFIPWAAKTFYGQLLKAGVKIFEYIPNILHAKTLILDDWMSIGSSNLNHRSLLHDLEIDVNIRTPFSKAILEQQFIADLKNSQKIALNNWKKRPIWQRFFGHLLLYIRYWI